MCKLKIIFSGGNKLLFYNIVLGAPEMKPTAKTVFLKFGFNNSLRTFNKV